MKSLRILWITIFFSIFFITPNAIASGTCPKNAKCSTALTPIKTESTPTPIQSIASKPTPTPTPVASSPVATPTPTPVASSPVATPTPTPVASSPVATPTPTPVASSPVATPTPTPVASSSVATPTPTPVVSSPVATPTPTPVASSAINNISSDDKKLVTDTNLGTPREGAVAAAKVDTKKVMKEKVVNHYIYLSSDNKNKINGMLEFTKNPLLWLWLGMISFTVYSVFHKKIIKSI